MCTIVPIEEIEFKINLNRCMELIFENNLDLPEDFYLTIMNLLKRYYEDHGTSGEKIHEYLNQNEKRIDPELFKSIKSFFKKKVKIYPYKQEDECCDRFKRMFALSVILLFILGFISPIVYCIIKR